jgi:hypothetical protein
MRLHRQKPDREEEAKEAPQQQAEHPFELPQGYQRYYGVGSEEADRVAQDVVSGRPGRVSEAPGAAVHRKVDPNQLDKQRKDWEDPRFQAFLARLLRFDYGEMLTNWTADSVKPLLAEYSALADSTRSLIIGEPFLRWLENQNLAELKPIHTAVVKGGPFATAVELLVVGFRRDTEGPSQEMRSEVEITSPEQPPLPPWSEYASSRLAADLKLLATLKPLESPPRGDDIAPEAVALKRLHGCVKQVLELAQKKKLGVSEIDRMFEPLRSIEDLMLALGKAFASPRSAAPSGLEKKNFALTGLNAKHLRTRLCRSCARRSKRRNRSRRRGRAPGCRSPTRIPTRRSRSSASTPSPGTESSPASIAGSRA